MLALGINGGKYGPKLVTHSTSQWHFSKNKDCIIRTNIWYDSNLMQYRNKLKARFLLMPYPVIPIVWLVITLLCRNLQWRSRSKGNMQVIATQDSAHTKWKWNVGKFNNIYENIHLLHWEFSYYHFILSSSSCLLNFFL